MFPVDLLLAQLMGAVAGMRNHQDSARKAKAVKSGIRRRAVERRQFVGGRRPYGYRHRDITPARTGTGPLVIDQSEAAVVRRIFSEYVRGVSQRQIALGLMADGVPTLTRAQWYATTVRGMLMNSLYAGQVNLGGQSFPAVGPDGAPTHEPIVDQETWDRACEIREATSQSRVGAVAVDPQVRICSRAASWSAHAAHR
jgi:site-specific DNA recombinase